MGQSSSLVIFCACIAAASLLGGVVPLAFRLTHRRLQFGLSFVSGTMLGVALFHMVPHALMARMEGASAADPHGLLDPLMLALGVGFLAMFLLERFAHFHQHEAPEPACDDPMHGHEGHHHHGHEPHGVGRLTWAGAAVGMGLHALLEGVALAASVAAASGEAAGPSPFMAGLGTFLVIVLHKPFDAMTVSALLRAGGGSRGAVLAVNLGFALMVPVGIVLFMVGAPAVGGFAVAVPYALAFSAGTFLCIAAADLLPEVQFHRHDRLGLTVALVLGLGLSLAVGRMEAAGHVHAHGPGEAAAHGGAGDRHAGHDHAGHDHGGHAH